MDCTRATGTGGIVDGTTGTGGIVDGSTGTGGTGKGTGTGGPGKGTTGTGGETTGESALADPAAALTAVLRAWWQGSTGVRPTQKALARRAGVDQATMSRYLNPGRPMAAPPAVVEVLHDALGAPPGELDEALRLARAAQGARRVPRARVAVPVGAAPPGPGADPAPVPDPAGPGASAPTVSHARVAAPISAPVLGYVRRVLWLLLACAAFVAGLWLRPVITPPAAGPAGAGATPVRDEWPVVRLGDVLWEARTVQYLLRERKYEVEVTGTVDAATVGAVTRFQRSLGLVQDGRVGPRTWPRLVVPLAGGDYGPAVEALQSLLTGAGHPTVVSGDFTSETEDVLRIYQAERGLLVTGRATTRDWLSLVSHQGPRLHG
ncbi:peptidoglycan-binding protein [Streptomyces sp. NPDC093105]|uniref:peptidoglycan-binding protein n=1 Tax=Streptomyces sp. NPDC093105 TaxID=3366029 RepID=UPI00380F308F